MSVSCCQPPASSMACAPPEAGGAVEVEEAAGAVAPAVLEDEVPVEQHRLHLGQQRVVAVDVAPARLDHARPSGRSNWPTVFSRMSGGRHEVGVEDEHELAAGRLEARRERARLEAGAVGAVEVVDVEALLAVALDRAARDRLRLVGGVVEDLDLEELLRIADGARPSRAGAPPRTSRCRCGSWTVTRGRRCGKGQGHGLLLAVPAIEVDHEVAVRAQHRQDHEGQEVETQDCRIRLGSCHLGPNLRHRRSRARGRGVPSPSHARSLDSPQVPGEHRSLVEAPRHV